MLNETLIDYVEDVQALGTLLSYEIPDLGILPVEDVLDFAVLEGCELRVFGDFSDDLRAQLFDAFPCITAPFEVATQITNHVLRSAEKPPSSAVLGATASWLRVIYFNVARPFYAGDATREAVERVCVEVFNAFSPTLQPHSHIAEWMFHLFQMCELMAKAKGIAAEIPDISQNPDAVWDILSAHGEKVVA